MQRTGILDALEEGLLSIDVEGNVTYINRAAAEILKIPPQEALGQPLRAIYPRSTIARVMETGRAEYNVNLESIKHVAVISDRMPLWRGGKIEGAVAIFRNRTEVTRLAHDLTGVQHIVEALRSYTHEFTNKLHVILGLLQLGETKQAEEYVLRITQTRAQSIGFISERIKEPSVAALLVGKAYRAAELGIRFDLGRQAHSARTASSCRPAALSPCLATSLRMRLMPSGPPLRACCARSRSASGRARTAC